MCEYINNYILIIFIISFSFFFGFYNPYMYEIFFEDEVFIEDVRYSWFDCLRDSSNYALSVAVIIVTEAYHGR